MAALFGGRKRGGDDGLGSLDPVKALQKELGIQSNRLNPKIKELVESAIAGLGYRWVGRRVEMRGHAFTRCVLPCAPPGLIYIFVPVSIWFLLKSARTSTTYHALRHLWPCRVTVGDVAARAGVKLSEADEALKALAFDSLGALEVSDGCESNARVSVCVWKGGGVEV